MARTGMSTSRGFGITCLASIDYCLILLLFNYSRNVQIISSIPFSPVCRPPFMGQDHLDMADEDSSCTEVIKEHKRF